MRTVQVHCGFCQKIFKKEPRRYNEEKKFGWNSYCSKSCLARSKLKERPYVCQNPNCGKCFKRCPKEIASSGAYYCSRSCAVTVNNKVFPRSRPKIRTCPACHQNFTGERKYCSKNCVPYREKISPEKIISLIKKFYDKNGRIPFRREFPYPKSARKHFGTWNKAILTAGFNPNPVRFSNKFIAKDGHKCDSLAEKIIDDWFSARGVSHQIHVRYGETRFTTDFLIGKTYVEFFGLSGQLKKYDQLVRQKLAYAEQNNLDLLSIYPENLFPKSKLDTILMKLL